jgi:RNA polymerase sigma-70 factor (family 1)
MSQFTNNNNQELLAGLYRGDQASFSAIYETYWKQLLYQAIGILGEQSHAEDCVQEVFLSLWNRRNEVTITHLGAYLSKAVRFQALWMIRNRKIGQKCYDRLAQISTELILHEPVLFKELSAVYHDAFQSLPDDVREIFRMVREEGLTYKQIAERKGVSVKTVERKMSLSLKTLRLKLEHFLPLAFFLDL